MAPALLRPEEVVVGKRKAEPARKVLCWRHQLSLFWVAWGSLLDLSGRSQVPASQRVFRQARECERCSYGRH